MTLDRILRALAALPAHKRQALQQRVGMGPVPAVQSAPDPAPQKSTPIPQAAPQARRGPVGMLVRDATGHLHVTNGKSLPPSWDQLEEDAAERRARSLA